LYSVIQSKNRQVTNMGNRAKSETIFSSKKQICDRSVVQLKTRFMYYRKITDLFQICETNFNQIL
jgi:hypothetical protein